jgi:putative transposase
MKKLNQRKIKWICREMKKRELSVCRIARIQKITPQWVRELYRKYVETGSFPFPRPSGRKPRPIEEEERIAVLEMWKKHPVCALTLEKLLSQKSCPMSHNRIHRILKEEGLAKPEPKKQKRRKWVRYERKHSNSLWHCDWFERSRKQIILIEDDASRLLAGFSIFRNATAENAKAAMKRAIAEYGCPKQIISDHGTQFVSLAREACRDPEPNEFQRFIEEKGIKHIKARVKHPQSNGKVEKLFDTLQNLKKHFGSWKRTVEYYNFERPHMSLENGKLRTPYRAFVDKMRKN